jgi:hypothetical protein
MTLVSAGSETDGTIAPSDGDLIAEIPPAMQNKLRRDSRILMWFFGLAAVLAGREFADSSQVIFSFLGILFALGGVGLCIASFFSGNAMLREELRYRRKHGKWRWER